MLFNSIEYLVFLPLTFLAYWKLDRRGQNLLILAASYLFYGWWDWRFLLLILWSSALDFVVAQRMDAADAPRARRLWLWLSLASNLGILAVFKYLGFFVDSTVDALTSLGFQANLPTLKLILPVGISFYTFQTLSYTLDVYKGQVKARKSWVDFLAFVSFFPQLVAGPIERASNMLPQFETNRVFDIGDAKEGLRIMLWGLFKKVVVADGLAGAVDTAFAAEANGAGMVLGIVLFAIQIYCDFSGYSDIAIGSARLFGFRLMRNFAYPYFATSIPEFWRRWHISLSTWFSDYVYIPLGGSRVSKHRWAFNIGVTFTLSGFWHGANWTFLVWGGLHALYYLPRIYWPSARSDQDWTRVERGLRMGFTFFLVCIAWTFFRADSVGEAIGALARVPSLSNPISAILDCKRELVLCALLVIPEFLQRHRAHPLQIGHWPLPVRWSTYYGILFLLLTLGTFGDVPFIYFQF